jgi:hypothetical protein
VKKKGAGRNSTKRMLMAAEPTPEGYPGISSGCLKIK